MNEGDVMNEYMIKLCEFHDSDVEKQRSQITLHIDEKIPEASITVMGIYRGHHDADFVKGIAVFAYYINDIGYPYAPVFDRLKQDYTEQSIRGHLKNFDYQFIMLNKNLEHEAAFSLSPLRKLSGIIHAYSIEEYLFENNLAFKTMKEQYDKDLHIFQDKLLASEPKC